VLVRSSASAFSGCAGHSWMGRAGIEPATLGLSGAAGGFGRPRSCWKIAHFRPLSALRSSAGFGQLGCPGVAPGGAVGECWPDDRRRAPGFSGRRTGRRSTAAPSATAAGRPCLRSRSTRNSSGTTSMPRRVERTESASGQTRAMLRTARRWTPGGRRRSTLGRSSSQFLGRSAIARQPSATATSSR
jgi:hypothetical protein